ncbi:LemA family protein [Sulfurospirillum deleyianum]|uniref:LemA family protein n=1 Tax=Sulfurospirillum deleyianum (strain ATCC 51133 / DSM 6946 / 5175) TaxID=525898 RepID=D1B5C8_SULD5|nr:LemA family protein [Sulfurospirillum deleyianum]ACZ13298.1 LemA family protein [Sulfurospirillum deleyianum DSM 6946]
MQTLLIVLGVILLGVIFMYNTLISKTNHVENIFAGLDAVLKKRYDLLPNLVASVKEYMVHERETLEKITALRTQALQYNLYSHEKIALDKELSSMLNGLMVAVENYPALKANENFLHLQGTLHEIEEQISAARRAYNQSVTDYNNAIEMFPTNVMAGFMKLRRKEVFNIPSQERHNVDVKNLFQK